MKYDPKETTQVRVFSVPEKLKDIDRYLRDGDITKEQHRRREDQIMFERNGKRWDVSVSVWDKNNHRVAVFNTTAHAPTFGDLTG